MKEIDKKEILLDLCIEGTYFYENEDQRLWGEEDLIINSVPHDSIFGPIFGVRKETLDRLPKEWLKHPTNKMEGCSMERRWSLMFYLINASKHYLEYTNFQKDQTVYNSKLNINKHFLYRL